MGNFHQAVVGWCYYIGDEVRRKSHILRDAHHQRVIQSLRFTMGADSDLINQFDQYRKKRNIGGYDMASMISQKEADGMKVLAKRLREEIEEWLRKYLKRRTSRR